MKHLRRKIVCIALPCVMLFILIYVLPFFITVGYSVLNNAFDMDYVGIDNYVSVFDNQYFQMALRNTIRVTCVLVIVTAIAALSLGFFLQHRKGKGAERGFTLGSGARCERAIISAERGGQRKRLIR